MTPNDVTCNIWSAFVYIFTEDMSSWELNIGFLQKNCNFTQFSKYTNEKNQFFVSRIHQRADQMLLVTYKRGIKVKENFDKLQYRAR